MLTKEKAKIQVIFRFQSDHFERFSLLLKVSVFICVYIREYYNCKLMPGREKRVLPDGT